MRTERVGFALCGSFCTHEKALTALKRLKLRNYSLKSPNFQTISLLKKMTVSRFVSRTS